MVRVGLMGLVLVEGWFRASLCFSGLVGLDWDSFRVVPPPPTPPPAVLWLGCGVGLVEEGWFGVAYGWCVGLGFRVDSAWYTCFGIHLLKLGLIQGWLGLVEGWIGGGGGLGGTRGNM